MPQLRPSWQLSVTVAAILLATAIGCRAVRRGRPAELIGAFAGEFTVVMALLALWQYIGQYVHTQVAGATERALMIFQWQRDVHLPSEVWVQHLVLPYPWLVRGLDDYYDFAHLNSMAIFLVWMWWRHRDDLPPGAEHGRVHHAGLPAAAGHPGGAAPADAEPRLRRHRPGVRAVGVRAVRVRDRQPTGGDAVRARRLGGDRRLVRRPGQHQPMALDRAGAHRAHRAGRGRHRQPLVAGRHRRGGVHGDGHRGSGGRADRPAPLGPPGRVPGAGGESNPVDVVAS